MNEVARATVTIIPNMQGAQAKISKDLGATGGDAGDKAGKSFGSRMVSALGKIGAAAAVGKFIKDSVDEGAKLQQSLGGIETLFKENADTVKGYASQAYKTAGLSANEYMENVTSFSAALIKSMDGDTAAAAELANTAMIDMSDNANKMGTDMTAIQNAYQGFAKGQYTMLDNLKLGYGGTKTEMERLLKDASELSGVEYNIDNLDDVYNAIHVIQEDLDITGTTAKEASSTFSGSFASMKAAATNLMGSIAIGKPIHQELAALTDSVKTFAVDNLLPMVGNVISQIPQLLANIPGFIADLLPDILAGAVDIVEGLADGIINNIPTFIDGISELLQAIPEAIINIDWGALGNGFLSGFSDAMYNIWPSIVDLCKVNFGIDLPDWETVVQDISDFWYDIKKGIGSFFKTVFEVGIPIASGVTNKIGTLWYDIKKGIGSFFKTVFEVGVPLVPSVVSKISGLWDGVTEKIGDLLSWILDLKPPRIEDIVSTLKGWWESVTKAIGDLFTINANANLLTPEEQAIIDNANAKSGTYKLDKDSVSIDSQAIQDALSNANLTLADIDTSSLDKAKEAVAAAIKAMETSFSGAKLVTPVVKTASVSAARTIVNSAVAGFKTAMNFSWSLPGLHGQLPVISVSMHQATSSDGKTTVSYPDLSVSSYKWFAQGAVFNRPTVIGIGDSKGPEAAVPLDMMWERMGKEFDKHLGGGANVTNYFTVDGAKDPEQWATEAARTIRRELRMT